MRVVGLHMVLAFILCTPFDVVNGRKTPITRSRGCWGYPSLKMPFTQDPNTLKLAFRGGASETPTRVTQQKEGEASRTMYNKQASNWVRTEPRCLSDFTGRPVVFSQLEPHIKEATVLDVGCGEGYCARKVVGLGANKVIGVDISEEMIRSAIQTSNGDERFKFFSAACSDLLEVLERRSIELSIKGAKESMDVAMAVFLFNYLTTSEVEEAMKQVNEALKPGGIFVFSVPHPNMITCHDTSSIFHLKCEGKGYFSSRNEKILGHISTVDGETLNIMSVHKTLNDYMAAIRATGFEIIDIIEAGVTDEHMKLNPDFFTSVKDKPLHLIFKLRKRE
mmetsp:Transcript_23241/g.35236  ORF Transcript_23241/g.35236 Transcript_23241/m.35236 type:complete len:335 (-) Transcript_23241:3483-4487(-)